jgi:hypothetical protein
VTRAATMAPLTARVASRARRSQKLFAFTL